MNAEDAIAPTSGHLVLLLLDAVVVPVLIGVALYLMPRRPWVAVGDDAQSSRRIVPSTSALAIAAAFGASVWLQEGASAAWSAWHSVATLCAGFALVAFVRGSHDRHAGFAMGCVAGPFMAVIAFVLVLLMQFPAWGVGDRALAGLAAGALAWVLCLAGGGAPATMCVVLAITTNALAALCMVSGFAKLSFATASVSVLMAIVAILIACTQRVTIGVGATTALAALIVGVAASGQAYDYTSFDRSLWWWVACAPIVAATTSVLVGRAATGHRAAIVKVLVTLAICIAAVVSANRAKDAASESAANPAANSEAPGSTH